VVSGVLLVIFVIVSLRIQNVPSGESVPARYARIVVFCRKRQNKDAVEPLDDKAMALEDDEITPVSWEEVRQCFDMMCFLIQIFVFLLTLIVYLSLACS
jgi:hypothetical protein